MKTHRNKLWNSFINRIYMKKCWYALWFCFLLWFLFLFLHDSNILADIYGITTFSTYASFIFGEFSPCYGFAKNLSKISCPGTITEMGSKQPSEHEKVKMISDVNVKSCSGRYIYVHNLPSRFNEDLLSKCDPEHKTYAMCVSMTNKGLGPQVVNSSGVLQNKGWFVTEQFMLEIIFHNRMKQYKCLTDDSSLASAIYVPYYAGLEFGFSWMLNASARDSAPLEVVKWLAEKPEWRTMGGKDHFFVSGRVTWDFRRVNDSYDWGNKLIWLPETKNMTMLGIESSPWSSNEFGIPYPTYYHPSSETEVLEWQNKLRRQERQYLFSFVGNNRPSLPGSIREDIIDQCLASNNSCRFVDCSHSNCLSPVIVMKVFQNSTFCLQPPGDSPTRRSAFDSILAGCIPVFFHPSSAYVQYIWHFPQNYTKYSVFIPDADIRDGKADIENILLNISKEQVLAMRNEVIKLIPRIIYADPNSRLESIEDAFDIAVQGVLDRVATIRTEMKQGRSYNKDFEDESNWKYKLFGNREKHEWDKFFSEYKQF